MLFQGRWRTNIDIVTGMKPSVKGDSIHAGPKFNAVILNVSDTVTTRGFSWIQFRFNLLPGTFAVFIVFIESSRIMCYAIFCMNFYLIYREINNKIIEVILELSLYLWSK